MSMISSLPAPCRKCSVWQIVLVTYDEAQGQIGGRRWLGGRTHDNLLDRKLGEHGGTLSRK